MLSLFRALMPKEGRFFELFRQHSLSVVSGAEALRAMLDGGEAAGRHYRDVLAHEDAAAEAASQGREAERRDLATEKNPVGSGAAAAGRSTSGRKRR